MAKKIAILHTGRANGHGHTKHIKGFEDAAKLWYDGKGGQLTFKSYWGDDNPATLTQLAQTLAADASVNLIAAAGGSRAADAAAAATNPPGTKPVVVTSVSTPNRQFPNTTGICARTSLLDPERLKLLYQVKPTDLIGALVNPDRGNIADVKDALNNTAALLGYPPPDYKDVKYTSITNDLDAAFHYWNTQQFAGVIVTADALFLDHADEIIDMANSTYPIATIYQWRDFTEADGLISLGPNLSTCYKLAGYYAGLILNGKQPQALPILSPAYEVVANLKTAEALKLNLPPQVLNQCTEIII